MNERIRELREQAWTLVSSEERDRGELYEAREQWERCDQKFAELIIRECMQVGFNAVYELEDDSKAVVVYQNIEKHFGVEG